MVKLFNSAATKLRDVFGSGRSERNASPSPGAQSADNKPSKPLPNKKSSVCEDSSLEHADDNDDDEEEEDDEDEDNVNVNTMPPSYNEVTAAPGNAVANDTGKL
ncbi:hypothetical protein TGAMA5MH_04458 [Trichoderma gamsii]|uniref:Uncharacterized protein n=1 Tax=Trichoderma gamsii TaxID=398673 RepID=A0A2K0TF66_9HYPO|nr:hypothetical protein TGAMA5MH_04458 [Trichoderma gamsii]